MALTVAGAEVLWVRRSVERPSWSFGLSETERTEQVFSTPPVLCPACQALGPNTAHLQPSWLLKYRADPLNVRHSHAIQQSKSFSSEADIQYFFQKIKTMPPGITNLSLGKTVSLLC